MKAPRLSRQLFLETPVRTSDGAGGQVITWQVLGICWAEINAGTGRERATNGMPLSRIPLRVVVRAAPIASDARPRAGQRFRLETRIFNINAVTEHDPEGRYLICQAEEEVAT